jgi:rod shape-determining protein MreC
MNLGIIRKKSFVIFLLLFIIILIFFNLTASPKIIRNFFYFLLSPFQKISWKSSANLADFLETYLKAREIKEENKKLREEVNDLLNKTAKLVDLEKENRILRETLNSPLKEEFNFILVEVLGKDISEDSLLIDKGLKDGIKEGLPLVNQQKVLIGRVQEVYDNFSKVNLIYNKNMSFNVKIIRREILEGSQEQNQENETQKEVPKEIFGLAKGESGGKIKIEMIPSREEIQEKDVVVTTNLGAIFPEGLVVGSIAKIKKSNLTPFQEAEIFLPFDLKELKILYVITKK